MLRASPSGSELLILNPESSAEAHESRLFNRERAKLRLVSTRDDALSAFVRVKIREWVAAGKQLKDLATAAGVTKSTPSQVLRGTGVGSITGKGFAKVFGYDSFESLQRAAYQWKLEQGATLGTLAEPVPDSAKEEALKFALGLGLVTEPQGRAILAAYAAPFFSGRDLEYWVKTLMEEAKRDREAIQTEARERKATQGYQRKVRELTAAATTVPDSKPKPPKRDGKPRKAS